MNDQHGPGSKRALPIAVLEQACHRGRDILCFRPADAGRGNDRVADRPGYGLGVGGSGAREGDTRPRAYRLLGGARQEHRADALNVHRGFAEEARAEYRAGHPEALTVDPRPRETEERVETRVLARGLAGTDSRDEYPIADGARLERAGEPELETQDPHGAPPQGFFGVGAPDPSSRSIRGIQSLMTIFVGQFSSHCSQSVQADARSSSLVPL